MALAARTEEGISAFIVEKEPGASFEGITVSKHVGKLGYHGVETVEMAYTDHRIPAANLIGEAGRGLPQILGVLEIGRINIASRAVGVARAAFDAALAYAQQRATFGKPIAEHQAIQLKLADMATRLEAARLLTRNAAERKAAGLRCDVEAGMAKLFASETALELAMEAMRIHGGVGLHDRPAGRALLPRRAAHGDRRGHQRDPAPRHRPRPARPGRRRPRRLGGPLPGCGPGAQRVLDHLPGGVHRQLVDDLHHPGRLVVGHLLPAPRHHTRTGQG